MTKKCIGCGVTLQNTETQKAGYTPKIEGKYCMRCFRLINYHDYQSALTNKTKEDIIKTVNKAAMPCFFLLDFLNINLETITTFKQITAPKMLIISKSDFIPSNINLTNLALNIKKKYQIAENILFLSSKDNYNINKILNIMETENISVAYILGYTNAGKSTLINKLLNTKNLTTSIIPNTTIDFLSMQINDKKIIDTPGFTYQETFYNNNEFQLIENINPNKRINPKIYQTKENQDYLIENRLRIANFGLNNIIFYMSNELKIEKIYNKSNLLDKKVLEINVPDNSDLVIKSLGFIHIKNKCNLKIYTDKPELIEVRGSIGVK